MLGTILLLISTFKFTTTSGEIRVTLVDQTEGEKPAEAIQKSFESINVRVSETEDISIRSISGDIRLINNRTSDEYPEYISIATVSGDIRIRGWIPSEIEINSTSGDIEISKTREVKGEGILKITTVSGDVSIECPPFPVRIKTISGDVDLYMLPESNVEVYDTIEVVSGELEIEYADEQYEFEGDTTVQIGKRTVTVKKVHKISMASKFLEKTTKVEPNIYIFQPFTWNSAWGNVGRIPGFSLDYNRVDGPVIGLSLIEFSRDKSVNNKVRFVNLNLGLDLRFGRKISSVTSKWENILGYKGSIEIGTGIGESLKKAKTVSLVLDGWINETSTHDLWILRDLENTLASIFLKYDLYDYFLSSSWGAGLRFKVAKTFTAQLGYRYMELDSLSTTQDFSIFNRGKEFRQNPGIDIFRAQGLEFRLGARFSPINTSVRFFRNMRDEPFTFLMAMVNARLSSDFGMLLARVTGGRSTSLKPFAFGIGGIGTLPAFSYKEFTTDRFVLLNTDFIAPAGLFSGILFADVAWMPDISVRSDFGLGVAIGGLSVRVAKKLQDSKDYKVYLRFKERF